MVEERVRIMNKIEDKGEIRQDILRKWYNEIYWRDDRERWTRAVIGSNFFDWMNRGHGVPDYYLTQFLTGHGCFGSYLHKFRIRENPGCFMCGAERDDPDHAFFRCAYFRSERDTIQAAVNREIKKETVIKVMLETKANWNMVYRYIRLVLETRNKVTNNRMPTPTQTEVVATAGSGLLENR